MTVKAARPRPRSALGPIAATDLYPLRFFKRLSGLGDSAIRTARKAGLRVLTIGGKRFVLGRDFIDYANRIAEQQAGAQS